MKTIFNGLKRRFCCSLSVALAAVTALVMFTTLELAAAEWQTADELRTQLIGNGAQLKGAGWSEKYLENGTINGKEGSYPYKGKWSFDGDKMCFDYKGSSGDGCWYIAIDGKKTNWWKPDGTPDLNDPAEYVAP